VGGCGCGGGGCLGGGGGGRGHKAFPWGREGFLWFSGEGYQGGLQGHPNIQHSTPVGMEGWYTMR